MKRRSEVPLILSEVTGMLNVRGTRVRSAQPQAPVVCGTRADESPKTDSSSVSLEFQE
jgi:hypothetical protein